MPLLLAACSGHGGSANSSGALPRPATLLVDTTTGNGMPMRGVLLGVVLESERGQRTDNLIPGPTSLELGSPTASLTGIRLHGLPADRYAAMHVLFAAGSVRAIDDRGQEQAVALAQNAFTIPFDEPAPVTSCVVLRHCGAFDLHRDPTGMLVWRPALAARVVVAQPVSDTVVSVLGVDRATHQLLGEVARAGGLPVTVDVGDNALLTSRSAEGSLSRWRFCDLLGRGSEVECRGWLDDKGRLDLAHGDDHGRSTERPENEVLGRITAVDSTARTVQVQVLEVRRGAADLPRQPLPVLTVEVAGARAHHDGRRHEPLTFDALQVGLLVEVEWRGAVTNNRVQADEIEIGGSGDAFGPEIEGRVGEVKLAERQILILPRKDNPLLVGGRPVASATIVVAASTRIFRRDQSPEVGIDLSQVTTQDRVWATGRVLDATRIEATVVRVRRE